MPNLPRPLRRFWRRPASAPALKAGASVSEHRLENGLRILLAERHADPVVGVVLFYRAGARNEREREAGLSHFLEHMMFKGSALFGKGEIDRVTTELGGQNNAFTSYDHTAYWFEFASDRWEKALEIESDRMVNLLVDPEELEAERAVVLEELAMGEDDPWRVLSRHVESALYPHHPYGRPIIGYVDTLRAQGPGDMRDYYHRFYHPNNATLVVCGDIEPRSALRAVRARFESIEGGADFERVDIFRRKLEEPAGEVRINTSWDDAAHRLIMGWPTVPVGTTEDFALDLAVTVLGSGRMSRLWRRIVLDEGLATSVSVTNDSRVDAGALWVYAECAQGVEPERLERALDEELERLAREKVTKAELGRAKTLLVASEAFDGETVSDVAEELGEWAVDADWRLAFDGCANQLELGAEDVQAAAARFLRRERRVTGWCHPRAGETRVQRQGAKARAAKSTRGRSRR